MPDVFISYRRDDRDRAEALAKALKLEALDVWWDASLETGQTFDEKIQGVLAEAKAVVVLWSPSSVKSEWVRAESSVGRERGVLAPVMVRTCVIPVPFNLLHTADLRNWSGDRSDPAYLDLVKQLKTHAGKSHVPPLKPPPNRQLRALWRSLAAVAVVALAGASLWVFRPWESFRPPPPVDPAIAAKEKRDASLARLKAFGVEPADFETYNWDALGRRVKAEQLPDLQKLADAGDAPAEALACAAIYWSADRPAASDETARKYCRLSAEAGEPIGETYYAFMTSRQDPKGAADLLKKASGQGFSWAQLAYASRLMAGEVVPQDFGQAEELLKGLADKGNAAAEYALGVGYWWGRFGREPDREAGVRLISAAADKGDRAAMYDIAGKYRDGISVPKDFAKARGYFDALAKQTEDPDMASRAANALQDLDRLEAEAGAAPAAQ